MRFPAMFLAICLLSVFHQAKSTEGVLLEWKCLSCMFHIVHFQLLGIWIWEMWRRNQRSNWMPAGWIPSQKISGSKCIQVSLSYHFITYERFCCQILHKSSWIFNITLSRLSSQWCSSDKQQKWSKQHLKQVGDLEIFIDQISYRTLKQVGEEKPSHEEDLVSGQELIRYCEVV